MRANEIVDMTKTAFINASPLRTGQLRDSAGDVGSMMDNLIMPDGAIGFRLFGTHGQGYYGSILNEAPTIRYNVRDTSTGVMTTLARPNRHYKYVDNFFERWADTLPLLVPGLRRVL